MPGCGDTGVKNRVIPTMTRAEKIRFWKRVNKNGPVPEHRPDLGPCWLWMRKRGEPCDGYGSFKFRGQRFQAHRIAVRLVRGRIRLLWEPDHLCLRKGCVNPAHIEEVPHGVNVRRGILARDGGEKTVAPALALNFNESFGASNRFKGQGL